MIFLDTNACVALINDTSSPIGALLDHEEAKGIVVAVSPVARGAAVMTRNVREFSRVPGLSIIDW